VYFIQCMKCTLAPVHLLWRVPMSVYIRARETVRSFKTALKTYRVGQKMAQFVLNTLTLSNINRFSKCFHCQNQEKICNKSSLKIPPHLKCIVTLAYLVKCQRLKSNNWKQDDFCNNTFLGHRVYTMPSDICFDFAAGLSVRVPGCQKLQMTA